MFEKSLQDLVKGIRSHKRDPSAFISTSIQEIKQELKNVDPFVKAQAVRKLTYLQMMGYDMSWASFAVVEVMSSPRFAHKRIGYLAACQTFTDTTDVVLLTTNLLKKEFQSPNQYEVGLAVNCLANIVTRDLARDLIGDIVGLIGHSKPYVRKKAVLSLYKLYVKYPQGLRLTFDRLKEKLEDPESAVVSCAVNVICELAHKNPTNYLALAPKFFRLLTTSSNNWMLIKVVKLLGSLVPEEPRLARKLLEPLATIIQNTAAKSLLYECIHTVTLALPFARKPGDGPDGGRNLQVVVALCAEHLRQFVEDPDQNLKYLGLVGFVNLMKSFPKAVVEHKELVLRCLSDDDVTIRMRALELLTGMVTRRNLTELVHKLMQHVLLAEGPYRDEIIQKILFMCSREKYAYLSDVPWYVSVLVDLAYVQGPVHGPLVAAQLIDVAVRAEAVRGYAVKCMLGLLLDANLFLGQSQTTMSHVLYAAGWIIGEYAEHLLPTTTTTQDGQDGAGDGDGEMGFAPSSLASSSASRIFAQVLAAYLDPKVTNLPEEVQVVYMQNALKVFATAIKQVPDDDELGSLLFIIRERIGVFLQSVHIEVQERASTFRNLLVSLGILPRPVVSVVVAEMEGEGEEGGEEDGEGEKKKKNEPVNFLMDLGEEGGGGGGNGNSGGGNGGHGGSSSSSSSNAGGVQAARLNRALLEALFAEQLQPVNPRAQKKVPVPEGLDLEVPLDAAGLAELESFVGGFPKDPDLAKVCFTHVFLVPEAEREDASSLSLAPPGMDEMEAAFGTPHRIGGAGRKGGYEETGSPGGGGGGYQPGDSRRRWQSTPFYLSSSNAAGGGGGEEGVVEPPNFFHLTSADLEGGSRRRGGERKKRRKKGHRRHRSDSSGSVSGADAVLREEVMPEGAVDSGGEEGEGGKKRKGKGKGGGGGVDFAEGEDSLDLKDIDITTPLRPDEIMPRMEHRPTQASAAAAATTRAAAGLGKEKEEGKRRKKQSKATDKEQAAGKRRSSSSRSKGKSKREGASAGSGSGGAPLIDFGDDFGHTHTHTSSSSTKPRAESHDTCKLREDAMDLLNFGESSPVRVNTSANAAHTAGGGQDMDLLLGGMGSAASAAVPQEASAPASSSSKRKKGKKESSGGGGGGGDSLLSMDVGGGGGSSSAAAAGPGSFKSLHFPLVKAGNLKVDYSLVADLGKHQVNVHFRVKHTASTSSPVSDVRLNLKDLPAGVSSLFSPGGGGGAGLVVGTVKPGETAKASLSLRVPEILEGSLSIPMELQYSSSGDAAGGGTEDLLVMASSPARSSGGGKSATLYLPLSAFLQPGDLSPSGFMSLLSDRSLRWQEANVRLALSRKNKKKGSSSSSTFDSTVTQLATFFQAQVIETTPPTAAAFYAKITRLGDHIALLAKFGGADDQVTVCIKAINPALLPTLVGDAEKYWSSM